MFAFSQHWQKSFKNLAIMAGIASILFLELGFTTFISTTDLAEKSSAIVANADNIISPLPAVENGIADTYHAEDLLPHRNPDYSKLKKQYTVGTKLPRAIAKVRSKTVPKRDIIAKQRKPVHSNPAEPNDLSEDIAQQQPNIASARKVVENPQETQHTQAPVIVKQRSEKRSFIASALPIIKKPYNWIKAIGSKMF